MESRLSSFDRRPKGYKDARQRKILRMSQEKVLECLAAHPRKIQDIAELTHLARPTVKKHLEYLEEVKVVSCERDIYSMDVWREAMNDGQPREFWDDAHDVWFTQEILNSRPDVSPPSDAYKEHARYEKNSLNSYFRFLDNSLQRKRKSTVEAEDLVRCISAGSPEERTSASREFVRKYVIGGSPEDEKLYLRKRTK